MVSDNQLALLDVELPDVSDFKVKAYKRYYKALIRLREEFHRVGRFDDSNAKLDEIVKLLTLLVYEHSRSISGRKDRLTEAALAAYAARYHGGSEHTAMALRTLSEEVLAADEFRNPDGSNVFGPNPCLNLQPTDDEFARHIVATVRELLPDNDDRERGLSKHFDVLNESFGHFVRDSFRNNIEDAQYMTPPEVVSAMVEMVVADLEQDTDFLDRLCNTEEPFTLLDPTCGVGSFMLQGLRGVVDLIEDSVTDEDRRRSTVDQVRDHTFGQDKVDRMVRLAKINMMLFGGGGTTVWQGNTVLDGSKLDGLAGHVDLILTNPPFGAGYSVQQVLRVEGQRRYPALTSVMHQRQTDAKSASQVDSELLLLDRCLSLLRPGGRLMIVLPDGAVSAKGLPAAMRSAISNEAEILAVVALPSVTFAQAGTRTKTCFVYLRKPLAGESARAKPIFMAVCNELGYKVVERTGVSVKVVQGTNELPAIVAAYQASQSSVESMSRDTAKIVSDSPSAVWVPRDNLINGCWTPNFYQARRLRALMELQELDATGFELKTLGEVARFASRSRPKATISDGIKVISVLHVTTGGTIDFGEVETYDPKGPGVVCKTGDVLLSRINPRIPRVTVVPETETPLACSTEFEVLEPRELDPYVLAALLALPQVQAQVECLTSGTSSSHNRIRDTELAEVWLPIPQDSSEAKEEIARVASEMRSATGAKYAAERSLRDGRVRMQRATARST